jgi:hypothetical protein
MKKTILLLMLTISLVLAGCVPEGFSDKFYSKATTMFNEIDEDTQEIENPDEDDIANLDLLEVKVQTTKDERVYKLLVKLADLNRKVLGEASEDRLRWFENKKIDKKAFKEYLKTREELSDLLEVTVYEFEFGGDE